MMRWMYIRNTYRGYIALNNESGGDEYMDCETAVYALGLGPRSVHILIARSESMEPVAIIFWVGCVATATTTSV